MHAVGSVVDHHLEHVRGPEVNPHGRAGIDLPAVSLRPSRHEISVVRCAIESEKKPCRAHRLTVYRRERSGKDPAHAYATHAAYTGRSHAFARQLAGLLHPSGELSFVELVVFMDVEVARVLALGLAGRDRTQRR